MLFDEDFFDFESIIEAIHRGAFNEIVRRWDIGTDRSIIGYMFKEKADIKKTAEDLGFDEEFIKNRIKRIVSKYDVLCDFSNHESFSRRGR